MRTRVRPKAAASLDEVMADLKSLASPTKRDHNARVGITAGDVLGVSVAEVRRLGREIGPNQTLADLLWETGTHEAQLLAVLVADPAEVSEARLEAWVADIGTWDLCDHFCNNLVCWTSSAERLALGWSADSRLYVRRAGLATIACLAIHRANLPVDLTDRFLVAVSAASWDERPHVRKAASWALRELGKVDFESHDRAMACAADLLATPSKAAQWVARDALRELQTLVAAPERRRLLSSKSKMGANAARKP